MGKAIEMSVRLDRVLVDQIAGRWHLLILCALCDHQGKARFNALKRSVPGISQKTLTQCLRQLERSGLVDAERRIGKDPPCDKAAALKLAQTLGKSLLGDAGNGALQSIESRLALVIAKCAEDQKMPAPGDLVHKHTV